MSSCFNLKISISQYRHVANAFANTMDISQISSAAKLIIAEQTGHSQATADSVYGLSAEKLRMLDSTSMNLFFQVSLLWHEWLGVSTKNKMLLSLDNTFINEETQSQSTQLAMVKKRILELENTVRNLEKKKLRSDISSNLHFINYIVTPPVLTEDKETIDLAFSGLKTILRSENPTFKSIFQKHSLHAILNLTNDKNGLIILPTNAGKSILYMIPSLIWRNTITVIILPLKSLLIGFP